MRKRAKTELPQECPAADALVWDCHVLEYGDVLDGWRIEKFLAKYGLNIGDVFIMAADSVGNCYIADKQGTPPENVTLGEKNDKS